MGRFMCIVASILYAIVANVSTAISTTSKRPQTLIIISIAARNDLSIFAPNTLQQLQKIGTNENVKIFIRYDFQKSRQCVTQHFYLEENMLRQIGSDLSMESGDAQSHIYTVQCAYEKFPADELVLILWNHGTGAIEPDIQKITHSMELFKYNHKKNSLEINRSIKYLDYISGGETAYDETKGICFDDASGTYLTVEKLTEVLKVISQDIIKKKIKILACDACLMAGADVFIGFEPYVDYFVGSQEAEFGTGYKYDLLLEPLLNGTMTADASFARHFVFAYKTTYGKINPDYTHAAIDLSNISELEYKIDALALILQRGLTEQKGKTVREALRLSRHKNHCAHFLEPSFIDLGHFCTNLRKNVSKCELNDTTATAEFKKEVNQLLDSIKQIIHHCVIANAVGKNKQQATGISIYFPEYLIHKSYHNNAFACRTQWLSFLKQYIATR